MIQFLLGSGLGWIAAILTGFDIMLPFLLRSAWFRAPAGSGAPTGYLARMWPHYWTGYLLLALSVVHASAFMGGPMVRANASGLMAATIAFCLLCVQALVGLYLQQGVGRNRNRVKRLHFWVMIALAASLAAHIWLNG
jgi:hypothetical protein